ncbi:MAG: FAD-binding oxidoreductase [Candidatus Zixiibacteriota bacterium]
MDDTIVSGFNGGTTRVDAGAINDLRSHLKGSLLLSGENGYDDARTIWNAMIDRHPALIAQCRNSDDIAAVVKFARANGALVSIKGAGHNIAGNAVCDGGIMIDLSQMNTVSVDVDKRRARVGPGATLGDVDKATQAHGLAVPTGINSTTGIAGLTLGGGFGWLSRKHGLTVDNLVSAEIITADGEKITASENDHADLFWAIRGGGGNFGVVSSFEFTLHPVGPDVLAGLVVYPQTDAVDLFKKYRDLTNSLSDDSCVWVVLRKAPPLPFLPESVHGTDVLVFAICHIGDQASGEAVLDKIRGFGTPVGEHAGMMPFADWQQAFDPLLTPGMRNYWKSNNFAEMSDGAIDALVASAAKLPSDHCEVFVGALGGAVERVAPDAMAYAQRDANFVMNVHGRWESPDDDDAMISWSRDLYHSTRPFATGGVYVNFMTEEETDRVNAAYGSNYDRLVAAKKKYDPDNFFRMNQNIT